jgi:putative transposase
MPKGKRHTEEQIIGILKQADAGVPMPDLCRQYGISNATLYHWKAKFGGMEISDAKRLKGLEGENTRLKHIVADLTLDNKVLKELLSKKF